MKKKFIKSTKRYKTMIINNPTHNVNEFKNMFETNNGQKIKNKIELIDKLYLAAIKFLENNSLINVGIVFKKAKKIGILDFSSL